MGTRLAILIATLALPTSALLAGEAAAPAELDKPPAEACVYEGRTASDWAKDLRSSQNNEKAAHALLKLGKDAVPSLVQLLKERDTRLSVTAHNILSAMKHERDAVNIFTLLLKDSDFEVRRRAVTVLGELAAKDAAAKQALTAALADRDKAVVEAAEKALESLTDQSPRVEMLLKQAVVALEENQWSRAAALASDALRLDPQSERANKVLLMAQQRHNQIDETAQLKWDNKNAGAAEEARKKSEALIKEAMGLLQRGDSDKAVKLAQQALALDANNEQAKRLLEVARKNMTDRRKEAEDRSRRREEGEPKDF